MASPEGLASLEGLPPLPKSLSSMLEADPGMVMHWSEFAGAPPLLIEPKGSSSSSSCTTPTTQPRRGSPRNSSGSSVGSASLGKSRTPFASRRTGSTSSLDAGPSRPSPIFNGASKGTHKGGSVSSGIGSDSSSMSPLPPGHGGKKHPPPVPPRTGKVAPPTKPPNPPPPIPLQHRMESLETKLNELRREMASLRQMDMSLLHELWNINSSVHEMKEMIWYDGYEEEDEETDSYSSQELGGANYDPSYRLDLNNYSLEDGRGRGYPATSRGYNSSHGPGSGRTAQGHPVIRPLPRYPGSSDSSPELRQRY